MPDNQNPLDLPVTINVYLGKPSEALKRREKWTKQANGTPLSKWLRDLADRESGLERRITPKT